MDQIAVTMMMRNAQNGTGEIQSHHAPRPIESVRIDEKARDETTVTDEIVEQSSR